MSAEERTVAALGDQPASDAGRLVEPTGRGPGVDDPIDVGREKVAHGAKWSLVSLAAKQATRMGFSIVLARMLGPENFGIIAHATIYLAFSMVFLDTGMATALIQRTTIDRQLIGTATWVNLAVLGALVAITLAGADLWASAFGTVELGSVLRVLSLTFVFNGFAVVPTALLTRHLDFKVLGVAEVVSSLAGGIAGVAAALAGMEYWALVVQTLVRDAVNLAVVLRASGRPVLAWSRESLGKIAAFSRNVFGAQILSFLNQNADNTMIAWRLGSASLANYTLSYRMLMLPVQILGQTANRMIFPVFARLDHDPRRLAARYLTVVTTLALAVTPLMVLVALGAPRGVPLVFGPDWSGAIRPMQILAVGSILRVVMTVNSAVMLARGKATWVFRTGIVNTVGLVGAFAVGLQWGIDGVAWSYLAVGVPLGIMLCVTANRLAPFGLGGYLSAVAPAAVGSAAMVGAWTLVDRAIGSRLGDLGALGIGGSAASVAFAVTVAVLWPGVTREQVGFVSSMVRGRRTPAVSQPT